MRQFESFKEFNENNFFFFNELVELAFQPSTPISKEVKKMIVVWPDGKNSLKESGICEITYKNNYDFEERILQ